MSDERSQHSMLRPETLERAQRGKGLSIQETHELAHEIERLRDVEEQYEVQAARIEQLSEQLVRRIGERDEAEEQLETQQQALRAYHAIFTAWEGRESITLNEEALRQWKSIAESALSNPATGAGNVPKSADAPASVPARVPHRGDYQPPEVDDWRPGDYRLSYPASEPYFTDRPVPEERGHNPEDYA